MFVKTPAFDELSLAWISCSANQSGVLNSFWLTGVTEVCERNSCGAIIKQYSMFVHHRP